MASSTSECPVCGEHVAISAVAAHVAECLDAQGFSAASLRRAAAGGGGGGGGGAAQHLSVGSAPASRAAPGGRGAKLKHVSEPSHGRGDMETPGGPGASSAASAVSSGGSVRPFPKKSSLDHGWTMMGDASLDPTGGKPAADPLDGLKAKLKKVRSEMQQARSTLVSLRDSPARDKEPHTPTPLQAMHQRTADAYGGDDFGFVKVDQPSRAPRDVPLQDWNRFGSLDATKYHHSKERKQLLYEKMLAGSWERLEVPADPRVVLGKMKFLVRRGVPDAYKRRVWLAMCGYFLEPEKRHREKYEALRKEVFGEDLPHTHFTVPLFGSESFQPQLFLHREAELRVYQRVLCVLATHNADVDFCPSLTPLVGILLMFLEEHEAFFVAQFLLRQAIRPDADPMNIHLSRNLKALRLKILTFRDLLAKRLPAVASHLALLGVDVVSIAETWFSRLFTGVFPLTTVLRIFDAFMLEGHSVLFRIGLALFANIKPTVMRCQSKEMLMTALEQVCVQYHSHDALIKKAYSFHFLQRHINRFAESNKQNIADVMEPQFQVYYRPHMDTPSNILIAEEVEILYMFLPSRLRIMDMKLVFSVDHHGYSINTFLNMTEGVHPTVLLIKTQDVRCFGAFVGQPWHKSLQPYGSRDSFLFSISPVPCKFEWNKESNDSFMYISEKKGISLGAGGEGAGLYIDSDLAKGTSAHCETYDNAPLCGPIEELQGRRFRPSDGHSTSSDTASLGSSTCASVDSLLSTSPSQWSADFDDFEWSATASPDATMPGRAGSPPPGGDPATPGGPGGAEPAASATSSASDTAQKRGKEYSFVPLKIEVYTFA